MERTVVPSVHAEHGLVDDGGRRLRGDELQAEGVRVQRVDDDHAQHARRGDHVEWQRREAQVKCDGDALVDAGARGLRN